MIGFAAEKNGEENPQFVSLRWKRRKRRRRRRNKRRKRKRRRKER